jgi:V/A-type H+-transporting ATPase subunit C
VEQEKVSYEFNPYTFARISAMKSLLLQKRDYAQLMKMDPSEIIKFMQDGVYRDEINALAIKYSGIKLVENSLSKHLEKVFLKLKRISSPDTQALMNQYLKRYDFWNLKTILRAKQTGIRQEEAMDMLLPVGTLKIEDLKKLLFKGSVREVLVNSDLVNIVDFKNALNNYETTKDLSEIENLLDYHYYLDSVAFAEKIPSEGQLFKEFFIYEFDIYNLKLILKKIFFKLDKESVMKFLLPYGKELKEKLLKRLLGKDTVANFLIELNKTHYGKLFNHVKVGDSDPLLRYEIILDEFLLRKSILLLHQHPLSVDVVLGFMFGKEVEVKNLRTIIKSKSLELTEDYVKNLIII